MRPGLPGMKYIKARLDDELGDGIDIEGVMVA